MAKGRRFSAMTAEETGLEKNVVHRILTDHLHPCEKFVQNWCRKSGAEKLVPKNWCRKTCAENLVPKIRCRKTGAEKTCTENLCRKTGAKKLVQKNWCRKNLSVEQKLNRLQICRDLLGRLEIEPGLLGGTK